MTTALAIPDDSLYRMIMYCGMAATVAEKFFAPEDTSDLLSFFDGDTARRFIAGVDPVSESSQSGVYVWDIQNQKRCR